MSENRTKEVKEPRSFEERVFLRFDAMDARFDSMEARLERVETRLDSLDERVQKLEAKQYDTKPIREKALAAIFEIGARVDRIDARLDGIDARLDGIDARLDRMDARFDGLDARFDGLDARLDQMDVSIDQTNARMEQGFEQLRSEMNAGFANQQERTDHLIRGVNWKIEALNSSVLKLQAEQVYFNSRLQGGENIKRTRNMITLLTSRSRTN